LKIQEASTKVEDLKAKVKFERGKRQAISDKIAKCNDEKDDLGMEMHAIGKTVES